jgi:hypothetical protein
MPACLSLYASYTQKTFGKIGILLWVCAVGQLIWEFISPSIYRLQKKSIWPAEKRIVEMELCAGLCEK